VVGHEEKSSLMTKTFKVKEMALSILFVHHFTEAFKIGKL